MRAYSLFDVVNFPAADRFETNLQTDHTFTVESTRFTRVGDICGRFHAYEVEHVSQVHFRGFPYHHGERLDEVSEKHIFDAYLHHDRSFLLMQYSRRVSREAARRLHALETNTTASAPSLDVLKLVDEFPHLYGTYFRDVQSPTVKSSALFGADVDGSEYYKAFRQQAKLSAVITEVEHEGVSHKVLISSAYGVGFYKPVPAATELSVIARLKPILDKYRIAPERDGEAIDPEAEEVVSSLFD